MIKLYNTAGLEKQSFEPQGDEVKIYTCGPTVYNKLHIGNWSAYIYWDILVRMLKANGLKVDRVLNITDVGHLTSDADEGEDKLELSASKEGKTAWDIARQYTEDFMQGMDFLGMETPEHIAKATDYIDQQIDLVRVLKQKGYTYQTSDGIYYDTTKFPRYADFAHLKLDQQEAGARIVENAEKKHPSDFALWKFSPEDKKREMEWPTPADITEDGLERMGFPGWHLECSAIAMDILGPSLDIHTGGIDHIPVHHTNEIAQSEATTGKTFSKYWLHNNHLKVNGTKISKSLNNGYTLDDLKARGYTAGDIRMFVLQGHYSNEGNFTFENIDGAKNRLHKWLDIATLRHQVDKTPLNQKEDWLAEVSKNILNAVNDNLDTPKALIIIDEAFAKLASMPIEEIDKSSLIGLLESIKATLGIDLIGPTPDISDEAKALIEKRLQARKNQDWQTSDELRNKLLEINIAVKDSAENTTWSYVNY